MINKLTEAYTIGGHSPNVSPVDSVINGEIFSATSGYSLARELFANLPLAVPSGQLINVKAEQESANRHKIKMVSKQVTVYDTEPVNVGISVEAFQDLINTWGLTNADNFLSGLIDGLIVEDHNIRTIDFLENNCATIPPITLNYTNFDPTEVAYQLLVAVAKVIHKANQGKFRTYGYFLLLPATLSHFFDALTFTKQGTIERRKTGNIILDDGFSVVARKPYTSSTIGPHDDDNIIYFGLLDKNEKSRSGAFFSKYREEVVKATDPNDGSTQMVLYNRFALTANPMHDKTDANKSMLWRATVTVT